MRNKWQKLQTAAGIGISAAAITYFINRIIFSTAVSSQITAGSDRLTYKWKFGNVSYRMKGNGSPLLLIHDLAPTSCSYEWNRVIDEFAKTHTVYAVDLPGCGYSDKPPVTYTAYLYVQFLNDFIRNVIGKRTDVIVTGDSTPFVIMACSSDAALFNRLVLVNPPSLSDCSKVPNNSAGILKSIFNTAIIGNSIYNMSVSKKAVEKLCSSKLFYSRASANVINALYETAHLGGFSARHLYASVKFRYTAVGISKALDFINNSIFIISGANAFAGGTGASGIIKEYTSINPAIESAVIPRSRHLPQLERPARFLKSLEIFL